MCGSLGVSKERLIGFPHLRQKLASGRLSLPQWEQVTVALLLKKWCFMKGVLGARLGHPLGFL